MCDLIVGWLLDPDSPILLVVDGRLFNAPGRKLRSAGWRYDATAPGRKRTAW